MLWSSALHSPQKGEHYIWCAHEGTGQFHVCKVWVSPPQTQCLGVDHGDFRHLDQKMSTVTKQRQMRVAFSAAAVCLRGANPSSTEILITTTPLYYTYTSNSNPPIINPSLTFLQPNHFIHFILIIFHHSNCEFPTADLNHLMSGLP